MIDEIAEVNKYIKDGLPTGSSRKLYRACYMISKKFKEDGFPPEEAVSFLAKSGDVRYGGVVNLLQCVNAAYMNENKLRRGKRVLMSDDDVRIILDHAPTETDRRVALALLCNAKAFADKRGVFQASTEALANWVGLQGANVRGRNIKRLCEWRYIAKVDTDKGHAAGRFSKYHRNVSCFKMLVPYENTGKYELLDNDFSSLYSAMFGNLDEYGR